MGGFWREHKPFREFVEFIIDGDELLTRHTIQCTHSGIMYEKLFGGHSLADSPAYDYTATNNLDVTNAQSTIWNFTAPDSDSDEKVDDRSNEKYKIYTFEFETDYRP